jgi:hypothetical protein
MDSNLDIAGKGIITVKRKSDEIVFFCSDGSMYRMYYDPDCCASCYIEDVNGDLSELEGEVLLSAYESTNSDDPPLYEGEESYTWTFYVLRNAKTTVTIRWYGSSNGYYSESASFEKLRDNWVLDNGYSEEITDRGY